MYRNDDKYHHGAFSGPNKHRLESLKNIIAVIGVIALIYFPYSIFVAPQFASPVVQTFPNQQQQQQQQQQGNDEPLDKRDLLKGLYNQDAVNQKQQEQKEQFSSSNNHHPDDVRLLKEMQTTIDRLTLERQADKEKQLTSGAALSEELRSAKDKYAKLNLINQEQQIDLDKVRARLETVSKELQTTKAQLERLRAMSPDADIQDYKPLPTVPWASKSWREQLGNVAWQFLHTVAARYPDKPTAQFKAAAHDLARSLQYLYPCDECRNHLNRNLRKVPGLWPPTVNSRESFSQWMCKLHNLINTQLDKPIFPCALRQLELRYMKNCDECVTNDPTMEKVDPIEDPVGYIDPVKQKSNNNNNNNNDNNKQNNVINKREELTPQQRRDRLLKLKQEQGDQWRPLEPERKYTGGQQSNNNNGEECTYKVSSWHQGTHQIVAGKVNLVVLFSPTCHVCKVYLPREVQQAYEKFKSRGLNLVAITDITPETESLLEQFVVDEKLTYPIGIAETDGPGTPYEKFVGKYKGVPAVLDIDATSCTVRKQLWGWRIESLDSYLEDRLPAKQ